MTKRLLLYRACLSVLALGSLAFGPLAFGWAEAADHPRAAAPAGRFAPGRAELLPFAGRYTAEDGRSLFVTFGARQDLRAFGTAGAESLSLARTGPDAFDIMTERGGTVRFERTADRVGALVLIRDGETTRFRRAEDRVTVREVRLQVDVPLVATLFLPRGAGPFPGAVIVHGSGTSDRDSAWYHRVTELLLDAGYAVLVPDKRGSGRSGGDWREAGFDRLAEDSLAAWRALTAEPGIRPDRVGLVGVSQGGWIVPLAASGEAGVAFVVNLVGSAVRPEEQVALEIENTLRMNGVPEEGIRALLAVQELGFDVIATGRGAEAFLGAYDALAGTPFAHAAGLIELPRDLDSWEIRWWKRVFGHDPIPLWNALCDRPAFIAYGADDQADNVPVAESVRRLTRGIPEDCRRKVKVYDGVGHSLSRQNTFQPDFQKDMTSWLRAVAEGSGASLPGGAFGHGPQ